MKLPSTVQLVKRIPGPNEPKRYYSVSTTRIYGDGRGVKQFLDAHPRDEFEVWEAEVVWRKVER